MNNKIKYCHLGKSDTGHHGVITVASKVIENGPDTTSPQIVYGVSYCSPNDRFRKDLGRKISKNRLDTNKSHGHFLYLDQGCYTHKSIMYTILSDILLHGEDHPYWALDLLNDYATWYNTNITTDLNKKEVFEVQSMIEWLRNAPNVDNDLLVDMTSDFLEGLK